MLSLKLMMISVNKIEATIRVLTSWTICEKCLARNQCLSNSHYYMLQLNHSAWKLTHFSDWETYFHFLQPNGNIYSLWNPQPFHSERIRCFLCLPSLVSLSPGLVVAYTASLFRGASLPIILTRHSALEGKICLVLLSIYNSGGLNNSSVMCE